MGIWYLLLHGDRYHTAESTLMPMGIRYLLLHGDRYHTAESTLMPMHCNGNSVYNCAASVPISTFMCLWAIYIFSRIGPHISSSRKGRPIVGIYNSLTETWMWKLGLRPRYSFSGNICFKFTAFCLCSVGIKYLPLRGDRYITAESTSNALCLKLHLYIQ